MNLVCIAKVAKIKMKKNGSKKLINYQKTGSFVKQTVGTGLFNLTWKRRRRIHFILHVVVISGTDLGSSLPSGTCQKLAGGKEGWEFEF